MQIIEEVMTLNPLTVSSSASLAEAARTMRKGNVGDVIVLEGDEVCGIVTDRDIAMRAVAEGMDPASVTAGEICSRDVVSLSPNDTVEDAIRMMREKAIRRLPIIENGQPMGIVSIGDLARARDPQSVLADISEAPPNS